MAFRVFVYGTLKRGMPNHYLMTSGKALLLGEAKLTCKYPLVVGKWSIPYLLPAQGQGKVCYDSHLGPFCRIAKTTMVLCMQTWRKLSCLGKYESICIHHRRLRVSCTRWMTSCCRYWTSWSAIQHGTWELPRSAQLPKPTLPKWLREKWLIAKFTSRRTWMNNSSAFLISVLMTIATWRAMSPTRIGQRRIHDRPCSFCNSHQ